MFKTLKKKLIFLNDPSVTHLRQLSIISTTKLLSFISLVIRLILAYREINQFANFFKK